MLHWKLGLIFWEFQFMVEAWINLSVMLHTQLFLQNKRWQVIIDFHIHPQLKSLYCLLFTTCYLSSKKIHKKFVYVVDLIVNS